MGPVESDPGTGRARPVESAPGLMGPVESDPGTGRARPVESVVPAGIVLGVPELAGPKTRLRPWHPEDAPALAAAWNDAEIRSWLTVPERADEAAALRWIEQRARVWSAGRSVDLAVTDPSSGAVIGEVGLSSFDAARRAALLGWWIGRGWRGEGRASEAVRLVVDWVLGEGGLNAVMAEIDADNHASAAVARRAGMRQVAGTDPAQGRDGARLDGPAQGRDGARLDGPAQLAGSPRLLFARTRV